MLEINDIIHLTNAKVVSHNKWIGHCPHHDDKTPSLSITDTNDKILIHCHAGCSQGDVLSHFTSDSKSKTSHKRIQSNPTKSDNSEKKPNKPLPGKRDENYRYLINKYYSETRGIPQQKSYGRIFIRKIHENEFAIEIPSYDPNTKEQVGAHLVFIDKNANNVKNTKNRNKKLSYNDISSSHFNFSPESNSGVLHICEGNEDGALISAIFENDSVVPRFGTAGLSTLKISPKKYEHIFIWADNDKPGQNAATKAVDYYKSLGFTNIIILTPNEKDWLDQYHTNDKSLITAYYSSLGWNEPEMMDYKLPYVVPITSSECHSLIYDWAVEEAASSQSIPDFFIASCCVTMCSFLARIFHIQPEKFIDHYRECPNIWGCIVAPPGSKKSNAIRRGSYSLFKDIEKKLREKEQEAIKKFNERRKSLSEIEMRLKSLKKLKEPDQDEIKSLEEQQEEKENDLASNPLVYSTHIIQDITTPAFIKRMSYTNNNVLFLYDELSHLLCSFNNQFKADLRSVLLESWNGKNSFRKETKTDKVEYCEVLSASVLGNIQPSVASKIIKEMVDASHNDGFTQRFQFLVYPDTMSYSLPRSRTYNSKYLSEIKEVYEELYICYENFPTKKTIYLSREARDLADQIVDFEVPKAQDEVTREIYLSFSSKLPKLYYALALLFEVLDSKGNIQNLRRINENAAKLAYNLTLKLFRYTLRFIYKELDHGKTKASYIVEKILNNKIYDNMKIRDIYRPNWQGLKDHTEVMTGLKELEAHGWIRLEIKVSEIEKGRPSEVIRINPYILRDGVKKYIRD